MIDTAGELKTKPTQHAVNELRRSAFSRMSSRSCRSTESPPREVREKIALFATSIATP